VLDGHGPILMEPARPRDNPGAAPFRDSEPFARRTDEGMQSGQVDQETDADPDAEVTVG